MHRKRSIEAWQFQLKHAKGKRISFPSLLRIKKANDQTEVKGLAEEITQVIAVMEETDVNWVEKVIGVNAL